MGIRKDLSKYIEHVRQTSQITLVPGDEWEQGFNAAAEILGNGLENILEDNPKKGK